MPPQGPINVGLVFGLACTGIVIGLLTCYVGLSPGTEFSLWMAAYVVWIIAAVMVDSKYPGLDVLLGSVLSGVFIASTQTILYENYYRSNIAQYTDMPMDDEFAGVVFPFAMGVGLFFGVVIGGISELVVRVRRKQKPAITAG
jgi:hypothetical protein